LPRDHAAARPPWLAALPDSERLAFRERGRELVAALLAHLDADDPEVAASRVRECERLATQYGRDLSARGSSLSEAVEGFLRFRSPFVRELGSIARRRGLDTREATSLLADAEAVMDRLLVAMMTGHTLRTRSSNGPAGRAAATGGDDGADEATDPDSNPGTHGPGSG
jgi:hypothetical protein